MTVTRGGRPAALPAASACLAMSAMPFVAAALALPAGLRWICLPFVALSTCALSPCLGEGRQGGDAALATLSVMAFAASGGDAATMTGLAFLACGVALGGHAAWSTSCRMLARRS